MKSIKSMLSGAAVAVAVAGVVLLQAVVAQGAIPGVGAVIALEGTPDVNNWAETPVSDDWFEPLNWSLAMVPQEGQVVIIPTGGGLSLTNATARLSRFELAAGAMLTVAGESGSAGFCFNQGTLILLR